jgi:hypothetical protein
VETVSESFSLSELQARARHLGLPRCAALLTDALPAPAPPDAGLSEPLQNEPAKIFDQMRRRGLDLELVRRLLPFFDDRPLEGGLFAWDVLCSTLMGAEDEPLWADLRERAKRVRQVLGRPGSAFSYFRRIPSEELVKTLAAPPFENLPLEKLPEAAATRALGPLDVLRRQLGADELKRTGIVKSTAEFAWQLHMSHLSTLASFYLNYLWTAFDFEPALPSYVDVLLDAGVQDGYPSVDKIMGSEPDAVRADFFGYLHARKGILKNEHRQLWEDMKELKIDYFHSPPEMSALTRMPLVHLAVGLEFRQPPVPFAVINSIAEANPTWRYAHLVRSAYTAAISPIDSDAPVVTVDRFLATFGNDFNLWYQSGRFAPTTAKWIEPVRARLVRELTMLPHDWSVWAGLAGSLRQYDAVAETIDRTAQQSKL